MKIPKKVNVLGHDYFIKFDKLTGMSNIYGLTQFPERKITILKGLKGEMAQLVLFHELYHAFQYENGDMQIIHPQVQEKQCDQFASFIMSLKKQKVL